MVLKFSWSSGFTHRSRARGIRRDLPPGPSPHPSLCFGKTGFFFFLFYFIVSEIERKHPGVLLLFSADIPRGRGWTRPGLASAWSSLPGQRGNRDGWIHARHVYGAGGRSGNDAEPVPWHCHFPFTGRGWRKAGVEAL